MQKETEINQTALNEEDKGFIAETLSETIAKDCGCPSCASNTARAKSILQKMGLKYVQPPTPMDMLIKIFENALSVEVVIDDGGELKAKFEEAFNSKPKTH